MGNLLAKLLPGIQFFKNSKIESTCCNKTDSSVSYTNCGKCYGSGKLLIKKYDQPNIDIDVRLTRESQIEIKALEGSIS